jgi:hypothetical protein
MTLYDNRRPGVVSRSGGEYGSSSNSANVVPLHRNRNTPSNSAEAFDCLTFALVLDKHRRGALPEAVVEALLLGVGLKL